MQFLPCLPRRNQVKAGRARFLPVGQPRRWVDFAEPEAPRFRKSATRLTLRGELRAYCSISHAPRSQSAFTLIEMIVVMLIIATLAALIMTGASSVIDRAKKVQAKNDMTQIVNSVNAYYTDYGKYPLTDARQGTDTLYGKSGTAPGNEDLCNVLRALATGVNTGDVLNPRKIVFLSGRDSSRARSGFATVATTDTQGQPINIGAFVDPYGNAYVVAIDGNYDGATVDSLPYTDLPYATGNTVRTGCFAESFGKDGRQGRAGNRAYSGSDDILSWQ